MNPRIVLLAFVGLAVIIIAIGALKFFGMYKRYSRHEMSLAIKKALKFSLGIFAFVLIIGVMFAFLYWHTFRQSASAIISLNYDEASEAKHANETRYNMNDIVSNEIIERAIKKGALENVSVGSLKDCVSVEQTVQGDSSDKEKYHISTEFRITFTADKYTYHLDPRQVVTLIAESYKDFYVDNYTENDQLLDMKIDPETEFAGLEYLDIVQKLYNKAYRITDYLEGIAAENYSFVRKNGETSQSLENEVLQFADVKIGQSLNAYILENSVAKDRTIYKKRLKYQDTILDYDLQKAKASFDTRNEAVKMYDESLMSIVLVPSWDSEGEYYMSRTKLGLDELSLEAKTYSGEVATLKDSIEYNKMVINKLNKNMTAGSAEYTDNMIAEISQDLENYALRAKKLVREYTENKLNRCFSISVQTWSFTKYLIACVLVTLLWYIGLSVLLISNTVDNYVPSEEKL